jgi:hypothetical protein
MTPKENQPETEATSVAGKGKPTPARKQQEAANRRPLVGGTSPEAKAAAKVRANESRQRARAGLLAGEEKYLTARDKGPQRRLARDIVDSRFTVGELMVPILVLSLVLTSIPGPNSKDAYPVQVAAVVIMWAVLIGMVLDGYILSRQVKSAMTNKFGADKVERGLGMYAAMRAVNMRMMRLPRPQVKRGTKVL